MSVVDDELHEALQELERATVLLRQLRQGGTSGGALRAPFARSQATIEEAAKLLVAARTRVEQALARSTS